MSRPTPSSRSAKLTWICCCTLALILAGVTLYQPQAAPDTQEKLPASLAQWYKPENKRQVWLHTMFKLRESMHAVSLYSAREDVDNTRQWATKLHTSYSKLGEMVPEWQGLLSPMAADALLAAAEQGDFSSIKQQVRRLNRSCDSCHTKWQPLTSALYRSPDYSQVEIVDGTSGERQHFPEAMTEIAESLGLLKIGRIDNDMTMAKDATAKLSQQLATLGQSCSNCHRDDRPKERILGQATTDTLKALSDSFTADHDPKVSGKHLGNLGYTVCGRCHSIHRNLGALRNQVAKEYMP